MNNKNNMLIIDQLDQKFRTLNRLSNFPTPEKGWISTIRNALKISLNQFAKKLEITPQSAGEIEHREKTGTISIKNLQDAANAMNMNLVYVLLPKEGSLKKTVEKAAFEKARKIVSSVSMTMKLEAQENSAVRLRKAVKEKTSEIAREMPKYLWD